MTDEELRRLLGMNAPLDTLSAAEFEALAHRIRASSPEHKLRVEAILLRDLMSRPELARIMGHTPSQAEPETLTNPVVNTVRSRFAQRLTLILIAVHSLAVTMVLIRWLHR